MKNYNIKTVKDLREICKELNISGYSRLNKNEIIDKIVAEMEKNDVEKEKEEEKEIEKKKFIEKKDFKIETIKYSEEIIQKKINIYHIADIHLNETMTFDNFKEWYSSCESGIIVLVGDILDKNDNISNQIIIKLYKFLNFLAQKHLVLMISGNHDIKSYQKNISLLKFFQKIIKNLYYLMPEIIYSINDKIYFTNISFINLISLDYFKENKFHPIVALYHGEIYNSSNDFDYTFLEENTYKSNDFIDFDLTFLGHIHKQQFISDKMAYSGSLTQLNFGESILGKGLIHWIYDLDQKKILQSKPIEFFPNKMFVVMKEDENLIQKLESLPNWNQRQKYLKIVNLRYDREINNDEIKEFRKKYSNINIGRVKGSFLFLKTMSFKGETIDKKLVKSNNDIEEFKNYIFNRNIDSSDDIIKIHLNYKEQLKKEESDNYALWKIKKISFMNTFGYSGDKMNVINLENKNNIVHIFGKNGIGKSSILSIILFALFGRKSSFYPKDVLNRNSSSYKIILDFTHGIREYRLENTTKRNGEQMYNKISLYENNKLLSSEHDKILEIINNMLGNYNTFLLVNVFSNSIGINFTDLNNKNQIDVLSNLFRLDIYDKIHNLVLKDIREIKQSYDENKGKISEIKVFLDSFNFSEESREPKSLELKINNIMNQIKIDELRKQELSEKIEKIINDIKSEKLEDKIKEFSNGISKHNISENNNYIKKIQTLKDKLKIYEMLQIKEQLNDLCLEKTNLNNELKTLDKKIKDINIINDYSIDQIKTELDKFFSETKAYQQSIITVKNNYLKGKIEKYKNKISLVKQKIKFGELEEIKKKIFIREEEKNNEIIKFKNITTQIDSTLETNKKNKELLENEIINLNKEIKKIYLISDQLKTNVEKKNQEKKYIQQNNLENQINEFIDNEKLFIKKEYKLLKEYFLKTRTYSEYLNEEKINNEITNLDSKLNINKDKILDYEKLIEINTDKINKIEQPNVLINEKNKIHNRIYILSEEITNLKNYYDKNKIDFSSDEKIIIEEEEKNLKRFEIKLDNLTKNFDNIKIKNKEININISIFQKSIEANNTNTKLLEIKLNEIKKEYSENNNLLDKEYQNKKIKIEINNKEIINYEDIIKNFNLEKSQENIFDETEIINVVEIKTKLLHLEEEYKKFTTSLSLKEIPEEFKERQKLINESNLKIKLLKDELEKTKILINDIEKILIINDESKKNIEDKIKQFNIYNEDLKEKEIIFSNLEHTLKNLTNYKTIIAFKEFPTYILNVEIENIIKFSNVVLNSIGTRLQIKMIDSKLYFTKDRNDFVISITSGYENLIINLVIKYVLQKLNLNSISQLLFIDEGLDVIDAENINVFNELLSETNEERTTFLITHSERFQSLSTEVINIQHNEKFGSFIP